jgi:hypothetical protein
MKKIGLISGLTALSVAFAAPVYAQNTNQVLRGGAIGGAGGAVAGALIPGLSTGEGALLGAGAGVAVTALTKNKKYYTDNRGRRYYVDKHGRRRY